MTPSVVVPSTRAGSSGVCRVGWFDGQRKRYELEGSTFGERVKYLYTQGCFCVRDHSVLTPTWSSLRLGGSDVFLKQSMWHRVQFFFQLDRFVFSSACHVEPQKCASRRSTNTSLVQVVMRFLFTPMVVCACVRLCARNTKHV